MAEALTTLARLLTVGDIQEDLHGALVRFQEGNIGHLGAGEANYVPHLRLARRSQERHQPVGVNFGGEHSIAELLRADNDVPAEVWEEEPDHVRVLFQGHDGVFRIKGDHAECARIRALLSEALRQKARIWFVAQKPDLVILDAQLA